MATVSGDVSTGLLSYWKMDEASGTREDIHGANDLAQFGTGGVGSASGKIENAADFERGDTDYLSISSAVGTSDSDFSYSFWINFESLPTSGNIFQLFCHCINNGSTDTFYQMDLSNTSGTYYLRTFDTRENLAQYTWTGLSTGTWYHIVYVADYNTATTGQRIYVNGSSVATGTCGTTNAVGTTGSGFTIGRYYNFLNGGTASRAFDGLIDEFGIWSNVLSSGDATTLYNSGTGIPYSSETTVNSGFFQFM
jgi:hypothetical protein